MTTLQTRPCPVSAVGAETIRISGQVQGVGFRPMVWKLATQFGLKGDVCNTANGVDIRLWGRDIDAFLEALPEALSPLAKIDNLSRAPLDGMPPEDFQINPTVGGDMQVAITPDAASCAECNAESIDAFQRRYRYPFTNCTNCGPRFSIINSAPYDRAKTSMRAKCAQIVAWNMKIHRTDVCMRSPLPVMFADQKPGSKNWVKVSSIVKHFQ